MAFMLFVWAGIAATAAVGYLLNAVKPAPTGVQGVISSIPMVGWIVIGLFLLILFRGR